MTKPNNPPTTFLKDYKEPAYFVDKVDLVFDLYDDHTVVHSVLRVRRNKKYSAKEPLILQGEQLKLLSLAVQGKKLNSTKYKKTADSLIIPNMPSSALIEIITEIHPEKNTELTGLYRSKSLFCTQCEAEGFRRITYYPDRPDVLSSFTTTIIANKTKYPVLLSNGNCVKKGDVDENRHFATWKDPHKKPCYLFALVAGNLCSVTTYYVTKSKRLVTLQLFTEWQYQGQCAHALNALKKAMRWDEDTYGLEYDLDIYMIVAVEDFNMGAMENKGLNIFNAKSVLARGEVATDLDFEFIDAVVGHEYFHNWSGNRVTCRDWFQLSLKEGFTVFREQQFMADSFDPTVALIDNVRDLRSRQFAEDAGPMSHPVQPDSYIEINNFYTSTIYEKGAEIIRMLKIILGWKTFRKAVDLYFKRWDGKAATINDFVHCMEEVSKINLKQFMLWYKISGTPEIGVEYEYDPNKKEYRLTLSQSCPDTPGQCNKPPLFIPIETGLLGKSGKDLIPSKVLILKEARQTFTFSDIPEEPYLSLLRNFSAPVKVHTAVLNSDLAFLAAHDSDKFSRWDASQKLSERFVHSLILDYQTDVPLKNDELWFDTFEKILLNQDLPLAFKSALLMLPTPNYLMELWKPADPDALYEARKYIRSTVASRFKDLLYKDYKKYNSTGVYEFTAEECGRREYKNLCLSYLAALPKNEKIDLVMQQWKVANNMTDAYAAIQILVDIDCPERTEIIEEFYQKWHHDPLVITKWFRVQAGSLLPNTLEVVEKLTRHPDFDWANPNKVYALIGGFASGNVIRFNDKSGKAYEFLGNCVLKLDKLNPQVAGRMMEGLTHWKNFDEGRQAKIKAVLNRILAEPSLSKLVFEIASKALV